MLTRTASDQLTALVNAALAYGLGVLLGVPTALAAAVAATIYVGLAGSFVAYRRHLAGLQTGARLIVTLDEETSPYGARRAA